MRKFGYLAWLVLRPLLIGYLLILLVMTFIERWLVYPAPPADSGDWQSASYPHEDIQLTSADGTRLHGWLFDKENPDHYIVYFHGNAVDVSRSASLMHSYREQLNAAVFAIDYRGYGKSEGTPHEAGVVADGAAAQRWMAERMGVAPRDIVLVGRSLGGGVAVAVAAEQGAKALVLQSTFARMVDTAAGLYPWLPVKWVMQNRYDSIARIAKFDGPVLVSHGDRDTLIPIAHARKLYAAIGSDNKQFDVWTGAGHNEGPKLAYFAKLREFLAAADESQAVSAAAESP